MTSKLYVEGLKPESLDYTLETLIDRHGLTLIVSALGVLCSEKAEHLLSNWQDKQSAKVWQADGRILDAAARKIRSDG